MFQPAGALVKLQAGLLTFRVVQAKALAKALIGLPTQLITVLQLEIPVELLLGIQRTGSTLIHVAVAVAVAVVVNPRTLR